MDHIAQIHLTKFVFLSFLDFQTILQKMCKGTGCKPFQFRRTVVQFFPVECHCRRFSDAALRCSLVCRPNPAKTLLPPFFRPQIPGKQFFPTIVLLLFPVLSKSSQKNLRRLLRHLHLADLVFRTVLDHQFRVHPKDHRDQIRRTLCLSLRVGLGVGKIQTPGRFRQIQIQIKALDIHGFPRRWRQCYLTAVEKFPVRLGQQTGSSPVFRDNSIVDPRKKQYLNVFQSGTLHLTKQHLICRRRDDAHPHLLKSHIEKLSVLLRRDRLAAKHLHHFIEQFHDHSVNLAVFLDHRLIALRSKILFFFR